MADISELVISLDLRSDLSGEDVAELLWQIGRGPAPTDEDRLSRGLVEVIEDESGEFVCTDPAPVLDQAGPAWKVDGVLGSSLEKTATGWHLASRQEVHPDLYETLEELFLWLSRYVESATVAPDGSVEIARLRWYEDPDFQPLVIRDDTVLWP
ncbi:hypothetical protein ABZ319_37530 [Nocardia sp. NPDC005978]|uniref:hypothetical protein n=1 Tax=Nocardia sp. NPDC005978 TaxID=3156725 RepID=UPI0033AF8568